MLICLYFNFFEKYHSKGMIFYKKIIELLVKYYKNNLVFNHQIQQNRYQNHH